MRDYLAAEKIRPELVLCSSALRTRETLGHILPALGTELVLRIDPALYGADAARLLEILRGNGSDVASIMLVGHNPAMHDLALELMGDGDDDAVARVRAKFPTAALATVSFDGNDWRAVEANRPLLEPANQLHPPPQREELRPGFVHATVPR